MISRVFPAIHCIYCASPEGSGLTIGFSIWAGLSVFNSNMKKTLELFTTIIGIGSASGLFLRSFSLFN
jgi:hypothetical protein